MAIQAPQYPAPIAPSFQSFAERQRMAIDDALVAAEEQEERVYGVAKEGAKAGFEYDQMLRGYMEAKYANPNLTFWEYSTKPSVAGAYRAEGRKQIAEHISGGGDINTGILAIKINCAAVTTSFKICVSNIAAK